MLLFCEGEITEPEYLKRLNEHWGNRIALQFPRHGTAPKSIADAAAQAKKSSKRLSKSDPNAKIEAIWCVFDRDQHLLITEALQQAGDNDIPVAFSDPCFELWLLLHFQDQTAQLERGDASRQCRLYMHNYKKQPDMNLLLNRLAEAEQRAQALCNRQIEHNLGRRNPWTEVHKLIQAMRSLSGL